MNQNWHANNYKSAEELGIDQKTWLIWKSLGTQKARYLGAKQAHWKKMNRVLRFPIKTQWNRIMFEKINHRWGEVDHLMCGKYRIQSTTKLNRRGEIRKHAPYENGKHLPSSWLWLRSIYRRVKPSIRNSSGDLCCDNNNIFKHPGKMKKGWLRNINASTIYLALTLHR